MLMTSYEKLQGVDTENCDHHPEQVHRVAMRSNDSHPQKAPGGKPGAAHAQNASGAGATRANTNTK